MDDRRTIMATITGEFFQPVRLHYDVFDHKGMLAAFKKLSCVNRDPKQERWVWLYDRESKYLRFKRSFADIPKAQRPIVIGSLFSRQTNELLIDLRSCERATAAIRFFDKHIPRSVAKVADAEVVNRLFEAAGNAKLMPHDLFDSNPGAVIDHEADLQKLGERVAHIQDPQEKLRIALEEMNVRSRQPLPEIERFPVHFYEDGIDGFENALRMRQTVAAQRWSGNTAYSMFDVIQEMVKGK